ncbi:ABC transporter substrate-binding protein [Paenibacillus piri]|uniref:Extracellular solute-binding protein n=1 Tax=Paenibacillus piri TaxID=2547395 RepID=A0A4R5KJW6_9BACL|nr:extracellular solute-binding protein [Paenibacillus piri]TDF94767.1 extracellular solute-binding protein [Paenibacillus piri]
MLKIAVKPFAVACSVVSLLALTACSGTNAGSPSAGNGGDEGGSPSGSESKTVSLSVMTSDRFLELAKQKFEEAHPGIKVDIKEYAAAPAMGAKGPNQMIVTKPDPKNTEKYVSSVGTELMSGKASDIIVMSGLPYKKYADKKLLENIGELMSKDASFQMNNYYTDIFDAMKYNGALYTVPVKFGLNMWLGNQAVLGSEKIDDTKWTWADFKAIAGRWLTDQNKDGKPDVYPLGRIEPDQLITLMLNSSFAKFVDGDGKKAKFNTPDFIGMLKLAKSMYDDKIIPTDNADPNNVVFNPKANVMMYLDMYSMPKSFFDGKAAYYDLPSENGTGGTAFTTSMPVAINSKSANKKEAWEFVKFLLSDEMQSARELSGFAVNRSGAKAQTESLKTLGTGEGAAGKGMRLNINGKELALQPASDQDIAAIEKKLNNVKTYAESDLKIAGIVSEETAPYFQGQKSAEEVAKVIQNKVSTYLQE